MSTTFSSALPVRSASRIRFCVAALLLFPLTGFTSTPSPQQVFSSPEAGVDAAVKAVKGNDQATLHAILGPDSDTLISSGDSIEDAYSRKIFLQVYGIAHKVVYEDDSHAALIIGRSNQPMPIPLVKDADGWRFDAVRGEAQIIQHRIERNEENAMQTCLAIVYAERQYAADHPSNDGSPVYTARFRSSPGQRDGLYWPPAADGTPSLLGALLSHAEIEGYSPPGVSHVRPYQGYLYRIARDSDGGSGDNRGKEEGFTIVAYPANYGVSGVRTFFVHADGMVYGKDLGANTAFIVFGTQDFNPSSGWQLTRPAD
jgi:hypothetical protein